MIARNYYLKQLINRQNNGLVKIITGIRRCGKSVLLFDLFFNYLIEHDVKENNIITIQLDKTKYIKYRNPTALCEYVAKKVNNKREQFYIFIDEVQMIEPEAVNGVASKIGIYEVLNELNDYKNLDVYVTGSNSKMLSTDIATEFRGRGDEVRIHPFSFYEFYNSYNGDKHKAFNEFMMFGGMPYLSTLKEDIDKTNYLLNTINSVYIKDIIERNELKKDKLVLGSILDVISSSVGSLTSPYKLSNSFKTLTKDNISPKSISSFLDLFEDSFLIKKAQRYDIRGKQYIDSPVKYYFEDVGLRNARVGFKEIDRTHIMENIIYNDLIIRGYDVDVGVIEHFYKNKDNKTQRTTLEIDFICTKGSDKYYIQSAYGIPDENKLNQEIRGFKQIDDSYQKIVILRDNIVKYKDESGILYIGVEEFLLDQKLL